MTRLAVALLLLAGAPAGAAEPWSDGVARPFVAGRIEAGLHGRLLAQLGWGKPHWAWAGVQGAALVTSEFAGVEAAARAALPFLDAQVALRGTRAFDAPFLAPLDAHREAELSGSGSRLRVVDAGLSGVVPALRGLAAWELEWVRPLELEGAHVFEPVWHVAIGPSGAGAFRLGWLAGPFRGRVRVGPFAEAVRLFGREEGTVWRAGGALAAALGPRLSLVARGLFPLDGPDRFRTWTATYGTLALRWSFATVVRAPGSR